MEDFDLNSTFYTQIPQKRAKRMRLHKERMRIHIKKMRNHSVITGNCDVKMGNHIMFTCISPPWYSIYIMMMGIHIMAMGNHIMISGNRIEKTGIRILISGNHMVTREDTEKLPDSRPWRQEVIMRIQEEIVWLPVTIQWSLVFMT